MAMSLRDGLRADQSSRIAFVGAGGKTTAMFTLARQLTGLVVCLNTAHLAVEQASRADFHVITIDEKTIYAAFEMVKAGVLLFTGPETDQGRLTGVPPDAAEKIKALADAYTLPVLIEADGSRMLPLKAPAAHEPPIPEWTNHVVYMIGLTALTQPPSANNVFRPEIFAELTGATLGQPVEMDHILKLAQNPLGALKNIPAGAKRTFFANQLDACRIPHEDLFDGFQSLSISYDAILAGSLRDPAQQIQWRHEPIAGIVLAAGESKRMGLKKQLLLWQGKPLVRHAAETALKAGLNPVIVVTGSAADEVEQALAGLPVVTVYNRKWNSGQASSIRSGMSCIPGQCGGVVFLLSDMPQVPVKLIETELTIHRREYGSIICPRVGGQRANPVLFDRQTFPALMELTGDSGGRMLFERYSIRWLDWDDPVILRDIDTPEDYQDFVQGGENAG